MEITYKTLAVRPKTALGVREKNSIAKVFPLHGNAKNLQLKAESLFMYV